MLQQPIAISTTMDCFNTLYAMALEELPIEEQAEQGTGLANNSAAGGEDEDANSQGDANSNDGRLIGFRKQQR